MLLELHITNYALISSLHLEFQEGFTVLTGETGAGKSILIGAISLLLGERASPELIRTGEKSAIVQGLFQLSDEPELATFLDETGIDTGDKTLLINREIMASGRSRASINGVMVTLNQLERVGRFLVDLHGQHAHQSLFDVDSHLQILDAFGQHSTNSFRECFGVVSELTREHERLEKQRQQVLEKQELYRFQVEEIEKLNPQPNEIETLDAELRLLDHAEKLIAFADGANTALKEDSHSLSDRLAAVIRQGEGLAVIDARLTPYLAQLKSALLEIDDAATELANYAQKIEYDPARALMIRDRLDELHRLARKYGGTVTAMMEKFDYLKRQLALLDDNTFEVTELARKLAQQGRRLSELAQTISTQRQQTAQALNLQVEEQLRFLGMERTRFQCHFQHEPDPQGLVQLNGTRYHTTDAGIDLVEFLIAPNLGEEPRPLAKIASGGEISRLMLALKTVLSEVVRVPTLIFDEADVGIGGRVAEMVGQKMWGLSRQRQVLCITHLPIIAALADVHIVVSKLEQDDRTMTQAEILTAKQREEEIARMLGGQTITDVTRKHARELMRQRPG